MTIAILGTGMVGRALAIKLNESGHQVILGTRNVENTLANEQADGYGNPPFKVWHAEHQAIQLQTFADAAKAGELLINCTSGMVSLAALEAAGAGNLNGKVLVDIANP